MSQATNKGLFSRKFIVCVFALLLVVALTLVFGIWSYPAPLLSSALTTISAISLGYIGLNVVTPALKSLKKDAKSGKNGGAAVVDEGAGGEDAI